MTKRQHIESRKEIIDIVLILDSKNMRKKKICK